MESSDVYLQLKIFSVVKSVDIQDCAMETCFIFYCVFLNML